MILDWPIGLLGFIASDEDRHQELLGNEIFCQENTQERESVESYLRW